MRHAPILIALAVATTARADGDRALHLAVHGSVDSAALGDSIAKELGVDVLVSDGTCNVPCLDVTVDGKRAATVVYSPRSGSSRARTIKLGSNTSQWTLVLTLLAGNIVRDEARSVLSELPGRDLPRPPGATEAVPPPPEPAEDVPAPPPPPPAAAKTPAPSTCATAPGAAGPPCEPTLAPSACTPAPAEAPAAAPRGAPSAKTPAAGEAAAAAPCVALSGRTPAASGCAPLAPGEAAAAAPCVALPGKTPAASGCAPLAPGDPAAAPCMGDPAHCTPLPSLAPTCSADPEDGDIDPACLPGPPAPPAALEAPVGCAVELPGDPSEDAAGEAPPAEAGPAGPGPGPGPEHSFLGLGLVPGLSTDLTHIGRVRHFISINALVGVAGGSSGLSLSGIADIERGLVAGFQVAGIVATAPQVAGTQIGGIAAVSGDVDGVQVAGTAAVARRHTGVQVGGIAAVSRGAAGAQAGGIVAFAGADTTAQLAGIASAARGTAGLQAAGIAAFAGKDANVQAAGISSVARGTANIQIAGIVNYARRLRGMQIAPINVAREVDGIQIGVINVGGSRDGFSFGLINIVPGGRYDLEGAIDSDRIGTVLFRHGGRRWHNVYGVGGHPVDRNGPNDDVWMYGLGFGPSLPFGNTVIDLEAIGWQVNHGPRHESDLSLLAQLRLSIAHHWGPFALVAGGIFNTYITNDGQSPLVLERRTSGAPMSTGVTVTTWPSAFVGVRI